MSGKSAAVAGLSGAALALVVAMLPPMEGVRYTPYRDPVGVLTVCYGHTGNDIIQGKKYTKAECVKLLEKDVKTHSKALQCVTHPLTFYQQAAFTSFAYNIGVAGFCKSKAAQRANEGNMVAACANMELHVKAKDRKTGKYVKLPGLVKRRAFERAVCDGDFERAQKLGKQFGIDLFGAMNEQADD